MEIKKDTCNDRGNLKKLLKAEFFFYRAFVTSSCNVFKSSRQFPSSARVCKCCDSSTEQSSTEIHVFFPTIIIICHPLLRLAITGVCVGHVGAGQFNIYFGPGSGEIKCPGHLRGGRCPRVSNDWCIA